MTEAPTPDEATPPEKRQRRSRSRHAGSIADYPTKKGPRWKYQLYVPKDPERPELGETRVTRGGFRTMEDAQAGLADALKKKAQHQRFQGKVPTLGGYAELWADGLRLEASTIAGYRKNIRNHIVPKLGDIRLDQLTAARIGAHYRELEKSGRRDKVGFGTPLSANTIHKVHVILAAILDAAADENLIVANPAKKRRTVKPPKSSEVRAQRPEVITWTATQLQAFLTWNRDELKDDLFPLWHTIAFTGMRRSEALALRWSDINFQTKVVSVRRAVDTENPGSTKVTKTRSARPISIDEDTVRVLRSHKATRGALALSLARADAYVFGDDDGALRVPDAITSRWSRRLDWSTAKIDGLTRVTLKGLRHTHATLLLELGKNPKVVQERLGHSTITTTMNIYSHVTPTMQKSAADDFAALVGRA
ncbi:MAG TPA: tyrosine-type recombinase/integrase [Microbacteriaceae bacterium]|nr:tyrosine-type recombinase/integrase [Microbacteriaceae bacterium]